MMNNKHGLRACAAAEGESEKRRASLWVSRQGAALLLPAAGGGFRHKGGDEMWL